MFLDENDFIKKQRALKRYFKRGYKYLLFKVSPTLKERGKKDGVYEVELPSDELFTRVYGKIKLKFSVRNDIAIIEDITPGDFLIKCYERDLPTYKGIPYLTKDDLKKIKIMEMILNAR